jgi:hypothetical protein
MREVLNSPEQAGPFSFCDDYLDRILQVAPIECELDEGVRYGDFLLDPSIERERLASSGYDSSIWHQLLENRVISHDVRAYIIAALSQQPRSLLVLKVNLRALDELDGLVQPMEDLSDRALKKVAWHTPALQWRLAQPVRTAQ